MPPRSRARGRRPPLRPAATGGGINPAADNGQTELRPDQQQTRLQCALILAAGACAERIVDPQRVATRIAATMDYINMRNLVSEKMNRRLFHRPVEYVDALGDSIDGRLIACSRRLVAQRWPGVERLANELRTRHRIEGAEAETILSV